MARFRASATATTLQLQLNTTATCVAEVVGYEAIGLSTTGSATRPSFTRPVTAGTPSEASRAGLFTGVGSPSPQCGAYASFSVAPTAPTGASSGSFNLPLCLRWEAARGRGILIPINSSGLLYAVGTGGHSWYGEIYWEEK